MFTLQSALEGLHPNIACMRHPDHIGSKGMYYAAIILPENAYLSLLTRHRRVLESS